MVLEIGWVFDLVLRSDDEKVLWRYWVGHLERVLVYDLDVDSVCDLDVKTVLEMKMVFD